MSRHAFQTAEAKGNDVIQHIFSEYNIERQNLSSPYDYLLEDQIPVEVKVRSVSSTTYSDVMIEKKKCDLIFNTYNQFIFVCHFNGDNQTAIWHVTPEIIESGDVDTRASYNPSTTVGDTTKTQDMCHFFKPEHSINPIN